MLLLAAGDRGGAAATDPDSAPLYPGACRRLSQSEAANRLARGEPAQWRLKADFAAVAAGPLTIAEAPAPGLDALLGRNGLPARRSVALGRRRADPERRARQLPFERRRRRCAQGVTHVTRRHGPPCRDRPPTSCCSASSPAVPDLLPSPAATGWQGEKLSKSKGSPSLKEFARARRGRR